jgi:hypothetical protein
MGMTVDGVNARVLQNVVGRCGGTGLSVAARDDAVVRGNTSYLNGGGGISVQWREGAAAVELNVAYANGGSGLVTSTSPAQTEACSLAATTCT